jgi:hypothetical protein
MTDARELLSEKLIHQIEETARAQSRKPAEVLEEAVRKYLDEQSWQSFVGNAEERNRATGRKRMCRVWCPKRVAKTKSAAGKCFGSPPIPILSFPG